MNVLCILALASGTFARTVTIYNDRPLLDVAGNYVDAHDGSIVAHNGTYYLYGERYGNLTGSIFPSQWNPWPQLAVCA